MRNTDQGFTLVELVMVIVILGVLAAVAVPKFVSLQGDARLAVLRGVEAAARSAADTAHAKALTQGLTGATAVLPAGNIEGAGAINLVFGYPATNQITSLVNVSGSSVTATAATGLFQINGVTTPASCNLTYAQPTAANTQPTYTVAATPSCN
jgi:MSHA pilin protein MshA